MEKFLIIGPGLIGGSLAKSLFGKFELFAISTGSFSEYGNIFSSISDVKNAKHIINLVKYIAITAPLSSYPGILNTLKEYDLSGKIVFECGSVKQYVAKLKQNFNAPWLNLTHPIAGSDKSGFSNANKDLFHGKQLILDESNMHNNHIAEIARIAQFGSITTLNARLHDEIYAISSHIPQLFSYIFNEIVAENNVELEDMNLQNEITAYAQFRRLGMSNKSIWCGEFGIFSLNFERINMEYQRLNQVILESVKNSTNLLEIGRVFSKKICENAYKYSEYFGSGMLDFSAMKNVNIAHNLDAKINISRVLERNYLSIYAGKSHNAG